MFILLIAMPLKPNRQRVHLTLLGKLFGTIIGIKIPLLRVRYLIKF